MPDRPPPSTGRRTGRIGADRASPRTHDGVQLAIENLALRQQLAVYKSAASRPRLRTMDRLLNEAAARQRS
jgi:hypothetical protein